MTIKFAAIGLTHSHIDGQTDCLLAAGAELVAFHEPLDELAANYARRYPQAKRVTDERAILEDASIRMVITAAIPSERAGIALAAMRHGKDVMVDKPGMTTFAQLDEIRRVQQETGRIFSVCYSEHFQTRSTVRAGELVRAGAIGKVVNTVGLGPHALNNGKRAPYFFDRRQYGGILCDIASHQVEQFLFFADTLEAEVVSASVANRGNPQHPGLQDVGDMHLRSSNATGYIRVDWMTPEGLGVWGDGRLTIVGTDGYIELRKYVDILGRPGKDHLFLIDRKGKQYVDCSDVALPYGPALVSDVLNRTETAMSQAHCFKTMELALEAQALAERGTEWQQ